MINRANLLKNLQALLPHIERDILAYSEANADLNEHLQTEYNAAVEAQRTAEHFVSWREAQITQAAVAWVLTCVFVRFLEDNSLLTEPVLAGPVSNANGQSSLQQAKERMVAYFNEHPTHEERHYLLNLFAELEKYSVIAELLDHRHNPLWQIPVSADGAKRLIDFFQKIDADSGEILHEFTDPEWDTRFLGDLYQDLSESVRKRYALLQTPEFVESFILDYTLEPAIQTFGLPGLRLIDPTCGSGHFLLTTFDRVFNQWLKREPGTNTRELAQRALDVAHGTDINPYAIAICRFRLLISAMKAAGSSKIKDAPSFHFNLACGDSLLHGRRFEWQGQGIQGGLLDEEKKHVYEVEDLEKLERILGQRYHVVVGNPPYIVVRDKSLNQMYRDKYPTCKGKYSLGVPFTERFFDLSLYPQGGQPAGYVGLITTNSFMKREFGKKLIEEYLPTKDLSHVVDTSGAYIPGHGTPTVIIFARNQSPRSDLIRAVFGIRGEPGIPEVAAEGKVWSSITNLISKAGSEDEYVSVVDQDRRSFSSHPWSLGGGGAGDLKEVIESSTDKVLANFVSSIGVGVVTLEDDAFVFHKRVLGRYFPSIDGFKNFVEGDSIRDWRESSETVCIFPYVSKDLVPCVDNETAMFLWRYRRNLEGRQWFRKSQKERGLNWFEFGHISRDKFSTKLSISFPFVATHNHFALDRDGRVFKQTAPVIKLPVGASEADHFSLLGLLNSSTACFWARQTFFSKRGEDVGRWGEFLEFDSTKLKRFPIPADIENRIQGFAEKLDFLSRQLADLSPKVILNCVDESLETRLENSRDQCKKLFGKMVALQEELDWHAYVLYGLTEEALCYSGELPGIELGQRSFEFHLARKMAAGEAESQWFDKHGSVPTTEIPSQWPRDYQKLILSRVQVIEQNQWIGLVEQPEYKRRWSRDSWDARLRAALKEWLLGRLELAYQAAELKTCAQLADHLRGDADTLRIAEIYCSGDLLDWQALVCELVDVDNVPQVAVARLKPDSMPKFRAWQDTWDMQRQEDAIDAKYGVDQPLSEEGARDPEVKAKYDLALAQAKLEKADKVGDIPLPPQYKSTDFRKSSYWQLRGKLDVPKERFFSLPGCEKGGDSTLVIGWAGLNHLQRAQAIAAWYLDRKDGEGWEAERLMPMLVALDELTPWLKQWHNEVDPEFGERMGDYYEGFLIEELRNLGITRADLLNWQPAAVASKRGGRAKKVAEQN